MDELVDSPVSSVSLSSGQQSPAPSSVSTAIPDLSSLPDYPEARNGDINRSNDNGAAEEEITKSRIKTSSHNNVIRKSSSSNQGQEESACCSRSSCLKRYFLRLF